MVLGFDRNKAYTDTGVSAQEIAPIGEPGNPMFWVARAKMSREPVPRLISSVPKNGNLKFGKNAPHLTHFPETLKFQIANLK